jgi:hypothetical protein
VCSLITTLSGTFSDADHTAYVAAHWTAMLEESIRRIDSFRATHPDHSIIDIQYADLVERPLPTIVALYSSLGLELGDETASAMQGYLDSHPKGRFGTHGYDLAAFGLDDGELTERFSHYTERYAVPREQPVG